MTYNCDLFESFTLGRISFHQLLTEYHKDIGVAISIKKFHHIKVIKLIEMITYYFYLFVSLSLERISFHQLLTTYYWDNGVAVSIMEFHQVRDIKLIVIITYYCDLFERFPLRRVLFHQLLTIYYKDIHISLFITKFHQCLFLLVSNMWMWVYPIQKGDHWWTIFFIGNSIEHPSIHEADIIALCFHIVCLFVCAPFCLCIPIFTN